MRYSQRIKPPIDVLRYDIPELVRSRIINWFAHMLEGQWNDRQTTTAYSWLLSEVGRLCLLSYGGFRRGPTFPVSLSSEHETVTEHFHACPDEEAIDFIEWCFMSDAYRRSGGGQAGVDIVNQVLRENGIGYEFSPYDHERKPQATKKTDEVMHATVVLPALAVLADPMFSTANKEIREAHENYRHGRFDDANTACCRAFETVLKTICEHKNWPYDKDKDTLSTLVEICRDKGLFPPFYAEMFKHVGTVRNKLGGHGKGPTPAYAVTAENVEHLIHITSANIILLAELAHLS